VQANKQPPVGRAAEATIYRATVPQASNRGMLLLSCMTRLENVVLYYLAGNILL